MASRLTRHVFVRQWSSLRPTSFVVARAPRTQVFRLTKRYWSMDPSLSTHKRKSDTPWIVGMILVFGPTLLYLLSPSAKRHSAHHGDDHKPHVAHVHAAEHPHEGETHDEPVNAVEENEEEEPTESVSDGDTEASEVSIDDPLISEDESPVDAAVRKTEGDD